MNIIIVGKNSFLGKSIYNYFYKYFTVKLYSFEEFIKLDLHKLTKITHIINCAITKEYLTTSYKKKNDLDFLLIKKIKETKIKYIFFSSRKVYKLGERLTEDSQLLPLGHYAKNKLISENFLKDQIKKNYLILRISNVLGKKFSNYRKIHKTFLDNFFIYRNKNLPKLFIDEFKDFITIKQLCNIIKKLIENNSSGTFNVSLGQKVYISEITKWLDPIFFKKINFIKNNSLRKDSFTLSNSKLLKAIKINISKKDLKTFCEKLL